MDPDNPNEPGPPPRGAVAASWVVSADFRPDNLPQRFAPPIWWNMDTNLDTDSKPVPADASVPDSATSSPAPEIGGPKERDPTRYGDWTVKGRCIDF